MLKQKETSLTSNLSPSSKEGGNTHDRETRVMSNLSPSHRDGVREGGKGA